MTSTLISSLNEDSLSESESIASSNSIAPDGLLLLASDSEKLSQPSLTTRKRRCAALARIDLSVAKLSVSNESLNSNTSSGTQALTAALSDDELSENSSTASTTGVFEFDKRSRMCSQSSAHSASQSLVNPSMSVEDCFDLNELECGNGSGGAGSATVI